jgi:hypothetical protein
VSRPDTPQPSRAAGTGGPTLGRYRIGEVIGSGGMGTVLRGSDEVLGRQVALKVLREDLAGNDLALARFRQEARIVASLSHPGIAAVYDFAEEGGRHAIVMELLDGEDLHSIVRRQAPLEPAVAASLLAEAADALAYAHARGAVHRDIKPANIFLTRSGVVKITDFGVAYAGGAGQLTTTGAVVGTPDFLSPEQVRGQRATAASDLYSLGCVGFELLTGRTPFAGDNPIAVATARLDAPAPSPRALNPAVGAALDAVIRRALDPVPTRRYASAGAMAQALRAAVDPAGATAASLMAIPDPKPAGAGMPLPIPLPLDPPLDPPPPAAADAAARAAAVAATAAGPAAELAGGPADAAATLLGGAAVPLELGGAALTRQMAASPPTQVDLPPADPFRASTPPAGTRLPPAPVPAPFPPGRRHSRWAWLWLPVMVLLMAGIIFDIASAWRNEAASVVVPSWTNASVQTATAAAQRLGLKVRSVNQSSPVQAGTVLSSSPAAGRRVKKGSVVTLAVSLGNQVHVDSVVSDTQDDATSALQAQGLNPVVNQEVTSDTPDGQVMSQDPPAGTLVDKGSTVTLTVATAPSDQNNPGDSSSCGLLPSILNLFSGSTCPSSGATPPAPGHHHHGGGQ